MRLLFAIILMMVFSFAATCFLPWWSITIVCFFIALMFKLGSGNGFLAGFLAVFLLWLVVALVKDRANEQLLSIKMAALFHFNNSYLFVVVAAVTGGLTGGFAGWGGGLINLVRKK